MIKKYSKLLLSVAAMTLAIPGCSSGQAEKTIKAGNIADIRSKVWNSYVEKVSEDPERKNEFESKELKYGEVTMRYEMFTIGEAPEDGYPLYITLHGGGNAPKEVNDQQWEHMKIYYRNSVENGVYVAVRGVRDTWNTHFNDESYPLYDRLIENMILFANVNPNRVYILGFSAGGDGVYQIAPRMADRFAAANMSAGHPNGVSMKNVRNLPFAIQVGEKDTAYERNVQAAIYDGILSDLEKAEGGYYHQTFIHYNKPHNFYDNHAMRNNQKVIADLEAWRTENNRLTFEANTNAIDWVSRFKRNPYPEKIVWDLSTRASLRDVNSFYWLRLNNPEEETEGEIKASLDPKANSVIIDTANLKGGFTILLNEKMLNIFKPVTVHIGDQKFKVDVKPSEEFLIETTFERGDFNYQFAAGISLGKENNEWKVLE